MMLDEQGERVCVDPDRLAAKASAEFREGRNHERSDVFGALCECRQHEQAIADARREAFIELLAGDEGVERSRRDEDHARVATEAYADVALYELRKELRIEEDERPARCAHER